MLRLDKALALLIGCLLIGYSAVERWLEHRLGAGREVSPSLCRFLPCPGHLFTERLSAEAGDLSAAGEIAILEQALRANPASALRWCDLAEALARNGDLEKAAYCFREAERNAPYSPPVLLRAATSYFAAGDQELALRLMSRVLGLLRDYDGYIFGIYAGIGGAGAVLTHGLPKEPDVAQAYLEFLLKLDPPGPHEPAWRWMISSGLADPGSLKRYVDFLLANGGDADDAGGGARRAMAQYAAGSAEAEPLPNRVFNGGFRFETSGAVLDWRVYSTASARIRRDPDVGMAGDPWSLRIDFGGEENAAFANVTQTVVAAPGPFLFQAWVRTRDLTTDQGVGFRIFDPADPARLECWTDQLTGTNNWTLVESTIRVPPGTTLLEIQVVRKKSRKFDNKISGVAWIDAVSLTPAAAE